MVVIVAGIPTVLVVVVAFAAAARRHRLGPASIADETQLRSIERDFRNIDETMPGNQ
jgi:hypothetical protein